MTGRLALATAVTLVALGALVGSLHGQRPTLLTAEASSAAELAPTAATSSSAAGSTWYCAAAAATVTVDDVALQMRSVAVPSRHDVVVANTTAQPVAGIVTVFGGQMAPRPPADPASASASSSPVMSEPPPTVTLADDPAPVRRRFQLGPHSRLSLPLHDVQPGAVTAAVVEADAGGVAVEQKLSGAHGSDVAPCASAAAPQWHFAWGTTERNAREVLVLFNPFLSDVSLDGTFTSEDGVREPLRWQGLNVPAGSVVAVDVGEDVTRRAQLAAAIRARSGALVVSRVQAVADGPGTGLSLAVGQPVPRAMWTFAEGPLDDGTGERLVLANPSARDAEVDVVVRTSAEEGEAAPQPVPFSLTVRAGRTVTLDLAAEDRLSSAAAMARTTQVWARNGVPVVAERVLQHPSFAGGTTGLPGELSVGGGMPAGATRWISPVVVHGEDGDTSYLGATTDPFRPTQVSVEVQGGLAGPSHPPALQDVVVPPGGQVELAVPAGEIVGPDDSATVVVDATLPVVVERSLHRANRLRAQSPAIPVTP